MVKNADLVICDSKNIEKYIKDEYSKYSPNTTGNVYEAGYYSYSFPGIDQYSNGNIKGGFKVYRFVGTPNPAIDATKYLK